MPHLAGHCDCGRQIHFPNDAALGHEWRCFKCGKVWTLSTQGKPLQNRGSKRRSIRKGRVVFRSCFSLAFQFSRFRHGGWRLPEIRDR